MPRRWKSQSIRIFACTSAPVRRNGCDELAPFSTRTFEPATTLPNSVDLIAFPPDPPALPSSSSGGPSSAIVTLGRRNAGGGEQCHTCTHSVRNGVQSQERSQSVIGEEELQFPA